MKKCNACFVIKPLELFYPNRGKHSTECRECMKERSRQIRIRRKAIRLARKAEAIKSILGESSN